MQRLLVICIGAMSVGDFFGAAVGTRPARVKLDRAVCPIQHKKWSGLPLVLNDSREEGVAGSTPSSFRSRALTGPTRVWAPLVALFAALSTPEPNLLHARFRVEGRDFS